MKKIQQFSGAKGDRTPDLMTASLEQFEIGQLFQQVENDAFSPPTQAADCVELLGGNIWRTCSPVIHADLRGYDEWLTREPEPDWAACDVCGMRSEELALPSWRGPFCPHCAEEEGPDDNEN
jgi:hypothetical protein